MQEIQEAFANDFNLANIIYFSSHGNALNGSVVITSRGGLVEQITFEEVHNAWKLRNKK